VESHGIYPKEEEIEDWVDGLLLILRGIKWIGPYKTAYEDLNNDGLSSEKFTKYFKDYMKFFFQAVELTSIYWKMVFELYDPPGNILQISGPMRKRFKRIVQNADLSSPLQKNILKDANEALQTGIPRKFNVLLGKGRLSVKKEKILSIDPKDVGKFS
jgi:hypothetical protein